MDKKGQATIFIILGILLVVVFAMIAFINIDSSERSTQKELKRTISAAPELRIVKNYIDSCVQETAQEGLLTLGLQGGYYITPLFVFESEFGDIPYFNYYGEDLSSSPAIFTGEFQRYMENNLDACFDGFEVFEEQGFKIDHLPGYSARTSGDKVFFSMDKNIKVEKDGVTHNLKMPEYAFDVRLESIYAAVASLMEDSFENPKFIDLNNAFGLMEQYSLQIDTMANPDGTTVFVIRDQKNRIQDVDYTFLFASKYSSDNYMPVILTEKLEMEAGEEFNGYIVAEDVDYDALEYYSFSFIDISRYTGFINYTPLANEIGEHLVNFTVFDGTDYTTKEIKVMIR